MPKIYGRRCRHEGCTTHASYDLPGQKGTYCAEHPQEGMINVLSKRCDGEGCTKISRNFDFPDGKGRFCSDHKKEGMINVVLMKRKQKLGLLSNIEEQDKVETEENKEPEKKQKRKYVRKKPLIKKPVVVGKKHWKTKCAHEGCTNETKYATDKLTNIRYCKDHRPLGTINVVDKLCEDHGCTIANPVFDYKDGKGRFCKEHKLKGMINVKSKTCVDPECTSTSRIFNYIGIKIGKYCAKHKKPGMVDVKSRKCTYKGCKKQPNFGYKGQQASRCAKHKGNLMIDVNHRTCIGDNCTVINPAFGYEWRKGLCCAKHKKPDMEDIRSKRCVTCPSRASSKLVYKGYCYRCFIYAFPDNNIVRNHKTKERAVADYIRSEFPEYSISFDRRIEGGCSSRRPDIMIDMGGHVVIIEIDENQHNNYITTCENKRLMELFSDAGMRPIVMIRFNPDSFDDSNGDLVSSCWHYTSDIGLCEVKENKREEWTDRLAVLGGTIVYACDEQDDRKEIDVIQLFYDGWEM